MGETGEPERRFRFSLRKVLLWMLAVALTLGILSPLGFDGIGWLIPFGWFVTVLVVRWSFGSRVAAVISVVVPILLFVFVSLWYMIWVTDSRQPFLRESLEFVVLGGVFCGYIGLVPFLFVEIGCRTIDWLDRIGQSDG